MALGLDRASFNQGKNAKYNFLILEEQQPTLTAKGPGAVCNRQSVPFAPMITKELTTNMLTKTNSFINGGGVHNGLYNKKTYAA